MPTNATPEYMREWRKTPAGQESLKRQQSKARAVSWAYRQLAKKYPSEFAELLRQYDELV